MSILSVLLCFYLIGFITILMLFGCFSLTEGEEFWFRPRRALTFCFLWPVLFFWLLLRQGDFFNWITEETSDD